MSKISIKYVFILFALICAVLTVKETVTAKITGDIKSNTEFIESSEEAQEALAEAYELAETELMSKKAIQNQLTEEYSEKIAKKVIKELDVDFEEICFKKALTIAGEFSMNTGLFNGKLQKLKFTSKEIKAAKDTLYNKSGILKDEYMYLEEEYLNSLKEN